MMIEEEYIKIVDFITTPPPQKGVLVVAGLWLYKSYSENA